jgi:hypothetical protein
MNKHDDSSGEWDAIDRRSGASSRGRRCLGSEAIERRRLDDGPLERNREHTADEIRGGDHDVISVDVQRISRGREDPAVIVTVLARFRRTSVNA